jgi:hypothetical protein
MLENNLDLMLQYNYDIPIYSHVVKYLHTEKYKIPFKEDRYLRLVFFMHRYDDIFIKAYTLPKERLRYSS